jgi:hypothetical protein
MDSISQKCKSRPQSIGLAGEISKATAFDTYEFSQFQEEEEHRGGVTTTFISVAKGEIYTIESTSRHPRRHRKENQVPVSDLSTKGQ